MATMSTNFELKVKAVNLPNYRLLHIPNCRASIKIDNEHIYETETVSGTNPEWNECFDISLNTSSTIEVQLFHVISSSERVMRGRALIPVHGKLPQENDTTLCEHKIERVGLKFHRGGSIVVSLTCKLEGQPSTGPDTLQTMKNKARGATNGAVKEAEILGGYDPKFFGNTAEVVTSSDLCNEVAGYVKKVMDFGDVLSQVHPYASIAWKVLTAVDKALRGQLLRDDKIIELLLTIRDMLGFVEDSQAILKIGKLQDTVVLMMSEIHNCALFIQNYASKGLWGRTIRDSFSTATDDRIAQFNVTFARLKSNFNMGINIKTLDAIVCHLGPVLETETEKVLQCLPGWNLNGVKFNESRACLDGTRQKILDNIRSWVSSDENSDEKRVLWLSGGAGTGKTSIANSIAVSLDHCGCLGASFFFNRDTIRLYDHNCFFGSLCFQLALFRNPAMRSVILSAVRSMGYIASSSLRTQARKLIVDTTNASKLTAPVVMVIDALDESGTIQGRKELLEVIAAEFPKLPKFVRVMITSRDEPDIRASLEQCSKELCINDAENTLNDITSYIGHRLKSIKQRSLPRQDWPGLDNLQGRLANCAGNLFVWASIACNFVEEKRNPVWRLNFLLDVASNTAGTMASRLEKLDVLYNTVLRSAFPDEEPMDDFHYVVGSILALETPLTRIGLDCLLGLGFDSKGYLKIQQNGHKIHLSTSEEIVSQLRSIIKTPVDPTGRDGPLQLLHPSVHEFLTSPHVDDHFRINLLEQNKFLAMCCLTIMNAHLHFDICKIGSPSLLNKEIKELPAMIDHNISEGLRYGCCSIGYHMMKVTESDIQLTNALGIFLTEHLMHWIEVMSLLGEVSRAEACLQALEAWVKDHADNASLHALVKDAIHFLRNSGHVIRLSALHIYFSALPLTPKTTHLSQCFIHKEPHFPSVISSHPMWPTVSMWALEAHTGKINDVMFSPDGTKLASASSDMTIHLWNVINGQAIGEALEGHTDSVTHVTFSPDGKKLASASYDKTVWLWDLDTDPPVGTALCNHPGSIKHIGFSPDGKKLASASDDIIQLWDIETLPAIEKTLKGHTDWVCHVTFSPDGQKLASASYDCSVQLWDADSGQAIGDTLKGHTGWVSHVIFSPDGRRLASASYDCTAKIWNVKSGQAISLKGHNDWICLTVFSQDGKKLASASYDTMIRLWDVETGQAIGGALIGHTGPVIKAIFSPDGKTLVSASYDKTVRHWDVEKGQTIKDTPIGQPGWFCHVAFSPDGKKLASAETYDKTVCLWEFEDHTTFGETLQGHTGSVNHVVFSPDGQKLASSSLDKTAWLWDVKTCMGKALRGHTESVVYATFSPDGKKLASASDDYTVRLWDVENCKAIGEVLRGHRGWITSVVFSPDGKKLASCSWDFTVGLWDVESTKFIQSFIGHTSWVLNAMFSLDGQKLASASCDQTVRIWDVESGEAIGDAFEPSNYTHYTDQAGQKLQIPDIYHEEWIREIFASESGGMEDSPVDSIPASISFDELGFLQNEKARILWLPAMLRGHIAVHSSLVAVGSSSGAITLIELPQNM